jgi:hypothetical protein
MTELEFKKLFEKHAENIVREIITPIENKIRAQIHDVDCSLQDYDRKWKLIDKRMRTLKSEQKKFFERISTIQDEFTKSFDYEISLIRSKNNNLQKNIESKIEQAIKSGDKAQDILNDAHLQIERMVREFKLSLTNHTESLKRQHLPDFINLADAIGHRMNALESKIK